MFVHRIHCNLSTPAVSGYTVSMHLITSKYKDQWNLVANSNHTSFAFLIHTLRAQSHCKIIPLKHDYTSYIHRRNTTHPLRWHASSPDMTQAPGEHRVPAPAKNGAFLVASHSQSWASGGLASGAGWISAVLLGTRCLTIAATSIKREERTQKWPAEHGRDCRKVPSLAADCGGLIINRCCRSLRVNYYPRYICHAQLSPNGGVYDKHPRSVSTRTESFRNQLKHTTKTL